MDKDRKKRMMPLDLKSGDAKEMNTEMNAKSHEAPESWRRNAAKAQPSSVTVTSIIALLHTSPPATQHHIPQNSRLQVLCYNF